MAGDSPCALPADSIRAASSLLAFAARHLSREDVEEICKGWHHLPESTIAVVVQDVLAKPYARYPDALDRSAVLDLVEAWRGYLLNRHEGLRPAIEHYRRTVAACLVLHVYTSRTMNQDFLSTTMASLIESLVALGGNAPGHGLAFISELMSNAHNDDLDESDNWVFELGYTVLLAGSIKQTCERSIAALRAAFVMEPEVDRDRPFENAATDPQHHLLWRANWNKVVREGLAPLLDCLDKLVFDSE